MDFKIVLLCSVFLVMIGYQVVRADFFPNYKFAKTVDDAKTRGLICPPGMTRMKIKEQESKDDDDKHNGSGTETDTAKDKKQLRPRSNEVHGNKSNDGDDVTNEDIPDDSGSDPGSGPGRRSHMNTDVRESSCEICVCSVEGLDEYCSSRPARNVNECLRMAKVKKEFKLNKPYSHERILSQMIRRRDYIWHKDELPYEHNAPCVRGASYYTNNDDPENTDIDVSSSLETPLDYYPKNCIIYKKNCLITPTQNCIEIEDACKKNKKNKAAQKKILSNSCSFCVCSTNGHYIRCIGRMTWVCDYYRQLRNPKTIKRTYAKLFKQVRPTYFRDLSHRLRRTMDDGVYDLLESGGDALCCDHPNGHRRSIHALVRNRLRQLRNNVPHENMLHDLHQNDYVDFIVNNDK